MTPWARRVSRDSVAGDREEKETERQGFGRVWWDRSKPEIERTIAIERGVKDHQPWNMRSVQCHSHSAGMSSQSSAIGPYAQGAVEMEQRGADSLACQEPKRRPTHGRLNPVHVWCDWTHGQGSDRS